MQMPTYRHPNHISPLGVSTCDPECNANNDAEISHWLLATATYPNECVA
ncbi:MAG: hypothetical protein IGS38_12025 [Synechococcales cyanobacterium M58_A2018_015]|nr:hypothetical protein [Synechococcales cyanobacterium M58_A2018_015]